MKNPWRLILFLLIALLVAIFAVLNVAKVTVHFGFAIVQWPLIVIILGALLLGAVLTALLATSTQFSLRRQLKKQTQTQQVQRDQQVAQAVTTYKKQLAGKEQQIKQLQTQLTQMKQKQQP